MGQRESQPVFSPVNTVSYQSFGQGPRKGVSAELRAAIDRGEDVGSVAKRLFCALSPGGTGLKDDTLNSPKAEGAKRHASMGETLAGIFDIVKEGSFSFAHFFESRKEVSRLHDLQYFLAVRPIFK